MAHGGNIIRINFADVDELQKIKGVGPAVARNILAFREISGNIRSLEELRQVRHAKIADEDSTAINYDENPDLNFSLDNRMENVQLSPSSSEKDIETFFAPENGVNATKETIVPTTPSVLNSQVLEMIDSKNREKNGAKDVRPKTSTFNWPAVSMSTGVKSEPENTMLNIVPGALYSGVSQGSTTLPTTGIFTFGSIPSAPFPKTPQSQITVSDSSGVFTAPGVSVKSEMFDTNVSVGVQSMAQGGYMIPASTYGLMPTGQVASTAMGTYPQTQGGTVLPGSQGFMVTSQATSGYDYNGISAPKGMINVQPNTSISLPHAQVMNPNMVSYAATATMPQSGYLPVSGLGAIPSMLPSTGYLPFSGQGANLNVMQPSYQQIQSNPNQLLQLSQNQAPNNVMQYFQQPTQLHTNTSFQQPQLFQNQFTLPAYPTQNQVHPLALPAYQQQQLQQQIQHVPLNVHTMPQLHAQQQHPQLMQQQLPQAYVAQPQPQTPAPHTPFPP